MRLFNMRLSSKLLPILAIILAAGCENASTLCCGPLQQQSSLRVVNAFTTPVDVLIDGNVVASSVAAGSISLTSPSTGAHTLSLRTTGTTTAVSQSITTASGTLNTIAVVRTSAGALATAVLDDTNSVVPAGATKVRVLHLAPNAGTLQVYRTQPDYQTPVSWQFPFTYQSNPTSLSAPFYQSTAGTWEIRIWQAPADASGWANAPIKVVLPLNSGDKRTIMILDAPGGGVRTEVL